MTGRDNWIPGEFENLDVARLRRELDAARAERDKFAERAYAQQKLRQDMEREVEALREERDEARRHLGSTATNERVAQAHSQMKNEWLTKNESYRDRLHFVYKQSHSEECYICSMLRRVAELEREVAALREALEQAVLLEHDPRLSDEENAELLRRAEIARAALAAGQLLGGERPVCAGDKTR